MKLYHCKKCGTFIGSYGCDELCPTCRRKETYLTKDEVIAMLEEIKSKITEKSYYDTTIIGDYEDEVRIDLIELDDVNDIIQQKINDLTHGKVGEKDELFLKS